MNTRIVLAISLLLGAAISANAAAHSGATDFRIKRFEARQAYAQQYVRNGPVLIREPGARTRTCTYQGGPKNGTWACR
jgi:hypothetical protein